MAMIMQQEVLLEPYREAAANVFLHRLNLLVSFGFLMQMFSLSGGDYAIAAAVLLIGVYECACACTHVAILVFVLQS